VKRHVVLNTRPREQAAELSKLLAQAGFEVIEAPAIDIVFCGNVAELPAVMSDLRADVFDWVVLASQNAGRAFTAEDLRRTRIVCGQATAQALGLVPAVVLERFSASAALEAMRPRVRPGERALLPRGAGEGRDEVREGLRLLGVEVTAPVVYRTGSVADADRRLRAGGIDAVTACSPSAVKSVVSALRDASPHVALVCLGETTAQAARDLGLRVDGVAKNTTMPGLVRAVEAVLLAREARV
jgi:uroporphyrinogen III methyltransferase / synthase